MRRRRSSGGSSTPFCRSKASTSTCSRSRPGSPPGPPRRSGSRKDWSTRRPEWIASTSISTVRSRRFPASPTAAISPKDSTASSRSDLPDSPERESHEARARAEGAAVNEALFSTLALTAVTIGSLHTAAPDHWVPFAILARARNWSARRTAGLTLLCGFGHVTVSALLGLIGLFFGVRLLESFGHRMGSFAPLLLIGFGVVYGLWGLRRAVPPRLHGHSHAHYDHVHDPSRVSAGTLFLLFSADPCVAVVRSEERRVGKECRSRLSPYH